MYSNTRGWANLPNYNTTIIIGFIIELKISYFAWVRETISNYIAFTKSIISLNSARFSVKKLLAQVNLINNNII